MATMGRKKKVGLHQKIHQHVNKHFHKHVHKILHVTNFVHHHLFHTLELSVVCIVTLSSLGFANLTGLNQNVYTHDATETAQRLLSAMQNPTTSLKQGNIISVWNMDMDVENSFAKGYCTYGAARVSPEFFPFSGENFQQRTWGGNAVDRCKNASDTGYKIGLVPSQGALVVYDAGGKFGNYGHVGKVLHYDKTLKKIIVRDMARVARGTMSDRREDITTANIKCYIYNSKTTIPTDDIVPIEPLVPITNTGNVAPIIPVVVPPTVPTNPAVVKPTLPTTPTEQTHPGAPEVIIPSQEPVVVVPPTVSENVSQDSINKTLVLDLEKLHDIAQHFITQNDLIFKLISKNPLKLGEIATLTLEIKDKKTGELYSGLLPFSFRILSTNDTVQSSISRIQMINNGSVDISLLGQRIGSATIVISIDDKKIGEFGLVVK